MTKVFISYRRKESADFSGRLFDRLCGYFGSERVYMDVDDLVAGRDYREQIGEIIDECSVVLAVIGSEWIELTDGDGNRRLDAPEDQLRIEIETAFAKGKKVIPVLIHGAELPTGEELPESIQQLATLSPTRVQSGVPFQGDVGKLLDRLENQGVKHPDKRFPLEMILIPLGIICSCVGVMSMSLVPQASAYVRAEIPAANQSFFGTPETMPELPRYSSAIVEWILWSVIPLALGPSLIVAGKRWCCLTKKVTATRAHFQRGGGRLATPKNSKAVYSLASGLTFAAVGILSIIPAVVFAIWALLELRRQKTWVQGRALAVAGVVISLLGIFMTFYVHLPIWKEAQWFKHYSAATEARAEGRFSEALEHYAEAEQSESISDFLYFATRLFEADTLAESGDTEEAKQAYSELVEFSGEAQMNEFPIFEQAIENLAVIYETEGDYESSGFVRGLRSQIGQGQTETSGGYGYGGEAQAPIPPAPATDTGSGEAAPGDIEMPLPPAPVIDPDA